MNDENVDADITNVLDIREADVIQKVVLYDKNVVFRVDDWRIYSKVLTGKKTLKITGEISVDKIVKLIDLIYKIDA